MKYKLPREFGERWTAALRSGKFKQGRMSLYNKPEKSFCCMGVAGILCGCSKGDLYGKSYLYRIDCLPKSPIPKELLVERSSEGISLSLELAKLNDTLGFSFNEIADWIEANVEFY